MSVIVLAVDISLFSKKMYLERRVEERRRLEISEIICAITMVKKKK